MKISDYIIGKVKNRVIIKITQAEWEIFIRVNDRASGYKLMPIVFMENTETGCWHVISGSIRQAYPKVNYQGKMYLLSRLVYEDHYGDIPAEKMVLHKCDNPRCINPDHLYLGTARDNSRDLKERGKSCFRSSYIKPRRNRQKLKTVSNTVSDQNNDIAIY